MRRIVRPLPLDQRLRLDAALQDAYAPLRHAGTGLSPSRVRAAVRWTPTGTPPLRGVALLGRAGELATAVAAAAFVFAASLAPLTQSGPSGTGLPSAAADEVRVRPGLSLDRPEVFARWLRVGRTVSVDDLLDPLRGEARPVDAVTDSPADGRYRIRQGLVR